MNPKVASKAASPAKATAAKAKASTPSKAKPATPVKPATPAKPVPAKPAPPKPAAPAKPALPAKPAPAKPAPAKPAPAKPASPASPSTLAQLEKFFQDQIQANGHVTIDGSQLQISGLDALLQKTVGPSLVISSVTLTLGTSTLKLTGVISFLATGFHVSLTFTLANSKLSLAFDAAQVSNTSLSLAKLVAQVLPTVTKTPAIVFSDLHISFDTSKSSFLFGGTAGWQIPLGQNNPTVQATLVISELGASVSGSLDVGTATFHVAYQLQKGVNLLTGSWTDSAHPLGWDSIVTALGLSSKLDLPANVPTAGFNAAQLSLDFANDAFTLTGQTAHGAAFFLASKQDNKWGFAFGAAVAGNWQFSQISSGLAVLDFLVFQQAYLLISSFTQAQFSFPNFAPMTTPIDIGPGLNFGAVVNFAAGTNVLSKNIHKLAGTSTASVEGIIGTVADTRLSASLGGTMTITKGLALTDPALIVIAEGPEVEIQGTLEIVLQKQVIDVTGRLGISPEKADFTVDVKGKSLFAPFGFTGVTLQEIGVSLGIVFTPPGLDIALEATFQVGTTPSDKCAIEFAVEPDAVNPILLWGQFSSISLPTIFSAMYPKLQLPAALNSVGLQDAYVYYCEQPTTLPDNSAAAPGFAISGTLDAYAFTMAAALKIDFTSGISGSAAMTPIHLVNHALDVTGTGKLGGPEVAFNTISSPFFDVTLNVQVMGVVGANIQGNVSATGFSFLLKFDIQGVLSETLQCNFTSYTNFSASTDLHFHLDVTVGPFTAPKTNINLGSIHINTAFTGHLDLGINSTSVHGSVSGAFDGRALPGVSFDASTKSLTEIPTLVINQIKNEASTIYADVLSNGTKWANMVASGAITGADDAGKVLTSVYGMSATEVQGLLQKLKLHGSTNVHVDVPSPHIDTPNKHVDAAPVHTDQGTGHVDTARTHADTSTPHADGSTWGIHGDFGGHADTTITPHVDSNPHVDTNISPHVDTNTPHVDSQPHVDQTEHIDV